MTMGDDNARVQLSGVLSKRPVKAQTQGGFLANVSYRRFFVIKDGFLLYYPESERREYERRKCINHQPKGLVPLGDCVITKISEPTSPFLISITNDLSQDRLIVECDTHSQRDKWVEMLEKSARVSWRNNQLGDSVIQQLMVQGDMLSKEKNDVYKKFYDEVEAHTQEKEKTEEMQKIMEKLESEKKLVEETLKQLKDDLEKTNQDLEQTNSALVKLEEEKAKLSEQQTSLNGALARLHEQKHEMEKLLSESIQKSSNLQESNRALSDANAQNKEELDMKIRAEQSIRQELENNLKKISSQMSEVLKEKEEAEIRALEQYELTQLLNSEKDLCNEEIHALQRGLSEIMSQKETAEAELKEEMQARIATERKLREAEKALADIEVRLASPSTVTEDEKQEMMNGVKALKRYFEDKAVEKWVDAGKPIIMRKSVDNRRRKIRAQTMKLISHTVLRRKEADTVKRGSAIDML